MNRSIRNFMICLISLIGISYFMMVRSEQQSRMTVMEIRQLVEKRTEVIRTLLFITKQELKSNPVKAAWAIKLLGELRSIEATDFLLDNITFQNPYVDEPADLYPAAVALVTIGYPGVQVIVHNGFKREQSELEQKLMARVIQEVLGRSYLKSWEVGTRLGRLIIQEHLRSAKPPKQVKERLVKFMEKYFPAEKPAKRR